MPNVIFFRHGEAQHNVAFRERGEEAYKDPQYRDAHLTQTGWDQVTASAKEALQGISEIDVLYTSPLSRCIQSAYAIREVVPVKDIYVIDNLIERQGGGHICNDRMTRTELKIAYPDLDFKHFPDYAQSLYHNYTKEFETPYYLAYRKSWFVSTLRHNDQKKSNIVVVTHHDVLESWFGKSLPNAGTLKMTLAEILAEDDKRRGRA